MHYFGQVDVDVTLPIAYALAVLKTLLSCMATAFISQTPPAIQVSHLTYAGDATFVVVALYRTCSLLISILYSDYLLLIQQLAQEGPLSDSDFWAPRQCK